MIRGLTLHRPWPWAFTHGDKRVENRKWAPPAALIGNRVALHAGLHMDAEGLERLRSGEYGPAGRLIPREHPASVIVAVALVAGCVTPDHPDVKDDPYAWGPFCWLLPVVDVLREPVPCSGHQGLWKLPAPVRKAIDRQMIG